MHKLVINKLGPIEHCELECTQFMTFVGFQASGKSTIAKAIYYFRTIKEDILEIIKAQSRAFYVNEFGQTQSNEKKNLVKEVENCLRDKFLHTFGSSWGMSNEMYIEYHFTSQCIVRISLTDNPNYMSPNYIWIDLGKGLSSFLKAKKDVYTVTEWGMPENEEKQLKAELNEVFADEYSIVYIPAGRSMLTLLSQQLGYIYAVMDDIQKRSLDSCTRDYIERILRIKPNFSEGFQGLTELIQAEGSKAYLYQATELIEKVLRGRYRYINGEEQIVLKSGKYVKLNYASSGQQESVWILNLLYYYLLRNQKVLFIIEEPESHLFPESQKYITELIALVSNCKHSVILTTHSPYVLGTLNNLLYAHSLKDKHASDVGKILAKETWLDWDKFTAWFVKEGGIKDCRNSEIKMIRNEWIDEISQVINADFDKMIEIQNGDEGE